MSKVQQTQPEALDTKLPPLSQDEFMAFNRPAVTMARVHETFRNLWSDILEDCSASEGSQDMKIMFKGLMFCYQLSQHHDMEESSIFPFLASRMPEFRGDDAELLQQHRQIHDGITTMRDYLRRCSSRQEKLSPIKLMDIMNSWSEVLFIHLDQEVDSLGAENMRKYWTVEEVKSMRW